MFPAQVLARADAAEAILFPNGEEDLAAAQERVKSTATVMKSLMFDLFNHPNKSADPNSVIEANLFQVRQSCMLFYFLLAESCSV